ncbi:glycosyl hydrolase [Biscogniauxia mediterranea]|nr:glycosyl hydrolase [Biscogniauxia mediterranea]
MTSISSSGNLLSFTPNANSYLYETFECTETLTRDYNAISFAIKGPAKASLELEIQTKTSCSDTSYISKYVTIDGLTGSKEIITIPFSSFPGAHADGITGFVWSEFSNTESEWQLSDIELVCEGGASKTTSVPTVVTKRSEPSTTGECSNLLVDDWESQSRLTFLYYNAMIEPTSDDGTMQSIVVSNDNRVTLTPSDTDSYFYSKTTCVNAKDLYGGISMRINAPRGTSFEIQLSSPTNCGDEEDTSIATQTTSDLGWSFDGTEKLYSIPFAKFSGLDLTKFTTIFFTGFTNTVTFGPMSLYCGSTPSEYIVPATTAPIGPTSTVPAPSATASALVIDEFASADANALGFWHGEDEGMSLTWGNKKLTIKSSDPDYAFYTQVSGTCRDMTSYEGSYLHIAYSGSNKFSVALQQHNSACDESIMPFPETWDSLEASRYASASDIYIPISHFNIERARVLGVAIKGFYTTDSVVLSKIEIVPSVPAGFTIPNKLPSGNLVFACKRPNSFAFAIDDGDPSFAQQVLQVVKEEGIKVTFFTVGAPLEDASTNLTNVYNEMLAAGHQIALHSFTHPKMEGLPDYEAIDWEYNNDVQAVSEAFGGLHTPYFRPPFGTEGARMRQRLAMALGTDSPYVVMWSVDVEDWLWATGPTPEKQLDAFRRDVSKGGNLVVMHYLYSSTVGYLREFIQIAKATGKQLMRVDQCMEDPNAPPL